MSRIYHNIISVIKNNKKLLAVLIDPDKMELEKVFSFIEKGNQSIATHIFVGASEVEISDTERVILEIKKHTNLPIVLFPGDVTQITDKADGILFLSLISGRNSEYLIGKHVEAVSKLYKTELEIIPTGYVLVESGKQTAVERVSETKPLSHNNIEAIVDTAKAGEILGMRLIYLEAGSGASHPVNTKIISEVKKRLNIPLIVGGGIRSKQQLQNAYNSGVDMVVIDTAFEENEDFFEELKKQL
ncbi:geranylgeranylglyceryl/heptaprenylglyceryl phosphate synthase [Winogradskyella sp.]|uniref:geranylgeranylglyceryl/heptaprenylglyceryl phosphate synthase n=1 Tax=Winogradskyella sp. TaxID=1883156 RepID=UPI0025E91694|nr:geranylgeranylglyceryl/heptaprenylglyceryl phosphate synthase [Winogradskyella sp.]MBT8245614.1 geranylgeranylglyceryl/heptaprenylglyceryl phosphate synthase [Winogradskyella sp.]